MLDTCHFEIHVHSLETARAFYVGALGLETLQLSPEINLLAVKAGGTRISIFANATAQAVSSAATAGGHVIFRTASLQATIATLNSAGIDTGEVAEAPGFMRYISLRDPSGNIIEIAQYLRDPLRAV